MKRKWFIFAAAFVFVVLISGCKIVSEFGGALTNDHAGTSSVLSGLIGSSAIKPPSTVTGDAQKDVTGYSALINWGYVADAVKHYILVSDSATDGFVRITNSDGSELAIDGKLRSYVYPYDFASGIGSKTIYFKIVCVNVNGKESAPSIAAAVTFSRETTYGGKVFTFYTSQGDKDGITLYWTPASLAKNYDIYRAIQRTGQARPSTPIQSNVFYADASAPLFTWSDSANPEEAVLYDYWIVPKNSDGIAGVETKSNDSGFIRPSARELKVSYGSKDRGMIDLTWKAKTGLKYLAEDGTSDANGGPYEIDDPAIAYKKSTPTSWVILVAYLTGGDPLYYDLKTKKAWENSGANAPDFLSAFKESIVAADFTPNEIPGWTRNTTLYKNNSNCLLYYTVSGTEESDFFYRIQVTQAVAENFKMKYYFKVIPVYNEGSGASFYAKTEAKQFGPCPAVNPALGATYMTAVTAVADGDNVKLSWPAVAAADKYCVYILTETGYKPMSEGILDKTVLSYSTVYPTEKTVYGVTYKLLSTVSGKPNEGFESEIVNVVVDKK